MKLFCKHKYNKWVLDEISTWRDWYFRVFGYGLSTQPIKDHVILFSERHKTIRAYHVLGQCWKPLPPVNNQSRRQHED